MRTLILSDLHLGSPSHSDLLRRADVRSPLLEQAREADRVVLLGDVLELRHGPPREAVTRNVTAGSAAASSVSTRGVARKHRAGLGRKTTRSPVVWADPK